MNKKLEKQYKITDNALLEMIIGAGLVTIGASSLLLTGKGIIDSSILNGVISISYLGGMVIVGSGTIRLIASEKRVKEIKERMAFEKDSKGSEVKKSYKKAPITYFYEEDFDEPYIHMQVEDFYDDSMYDYGSVYGFLLEYLETTKKDILDVCREFGLSDEGIMVVYLNMAKNYYLQGDISMGDKYLNEVCQSKDKSDEVKKIIQEIMEKRKFYQYRDNAKKRTLSLDMKPTSLRK